MYQFWPSCVQGNAFELGVRKGRDAWPLWSLCLVDSPLASWALVAWPSFVSCSQDYWILSGPASNMSQLAQSGRRPKPLLEPGQSLGRKRRRESRSTHHLCSTSPPGGPDASHRPDQSYHHHRRPPPSARTTLPSHLPVRPPSGAAHPPISVAADRAPSLHYDDITTC